MIKYDSNNSSNLVDCKTKVIINELLCSDCRVLVLDSGSIIEFDSPANLLSRDGLFKKLAQDARLA